MSAPPPHPHPLSLEDIIDYTRLDWLQKKIKCKGENK